MFQWCLSPFWYHTIMVYSFLYDPFVFIIKLSTTTHQFSSSCSIAGPGIWIIGRKQFCRTLAGRSIALLVLVSSKIWQYQTITQFSFPLLKIIHSSFQPPPCLSIHGICRTPISCYTSGCSSITLCVSWSRQGLQWIFLNILPENANTTWFFPHLSSAKLL